MAQTARNQVLNLQDTGCPAKDLIHHRDDKYPTPLDTTLADAGIQVVLTGIHVPRTNALTDRWVRTCRHELLDHTLIRNQRHLLHALHEFEDFYNTHRPHQDITKARPLPPLPEPIADPDRLAHLNIRRPDRLDGVPHQYEHAT